MSEILIEASRVGDLTAIDEQINLGVFVDCLNEFNRTPLMIASENNHLNVVCKLIEFGANVNAIDQFGDSVLMFATDNGNIEIIKLLIDSGADIHYAGEYSSALLKAIEKNHFAIFQLLIDSGVDYKLKNASDTALIRAAAHGRRKIVKLLVKWGVDLEDTDFDGRTALMLACVHGQFKIVKFLIYSGARFDAIDYNSPLNFAAMEGHANIAKLLIHHGADLDEFYCKTESFPLLNAMWSSNMEVVQLFVESGADLHQSRKRSLSALHNAVFDNHHDIAIAFLQYGADPRRIQYNVPLYCSNNLDLTKLIVYRGCDPENSGLPYLCERETLETLKLMIQSGVDVNEKDFRGRTALFYAMFLPEASKLVKLLIDSGADALMIDHGSDQGSNFENLTLRRANPEAFESSLYSIDLFGGFTRNVELGPAFFINFFKF